MSPCQFKGAHTLLGWHSLKVSAIQGDSAGLAEVAGIFKEAPQSRVQSFIRFKSDSKQVINFH